MGDFESSGFLVLSRKFPRTAPNCKSNWTLAGNAGEMAVCFTAGVSVPQKITKITNAVSYTWLKTS
jgi:hypothetical protein